jgi:hypothetical protein
MSSAQRSPLNIWIARLFILLAAVMIGATLASMWNLSRGSKTALATCGKDNVQAVQANPFGFSYQCKPDAF